MDLCILLDNFLTKADEKILQCEVKPYTKRYNKEK